jgi:hypothetical protein
MNWQMERLTPIDLAQLRDRLASSQTIFLMKKEQRFLTRADERDTLR